MPKGMLRSIAATAALAVMCTAAPPAQSKFTLTVHTGRGQVGYDVNSTMIAGERDMIVIDPQFSLSEAHKLAAAILESKKRGTAHARPPVTRRGSSASRSPSPRKLNAMTVTKIAAPGTNSSQGKLVSARMLRA